jgi:arylsulfatase
MQSTSPNILVILVDDMGFSDIGCYGSEIPTPNLDALAKNGVRFTQFYNTGRCCPTRASLLTGLYPHQAGVGHMTDDRGLPGYSGRLNDQCATMAEVLKPAGYFTAMSGKWHIGQNHGVIPSKRGFDRSLHAAAGGFYFPQDGRSRVFLDGQPAANLPKDWYSTDLWTEYAIRFVDKAKGQKKPFFLYLAFNAPHFPLQAPAEDIARLRGRYKAGWDALRQERLSRQKSLGLSGKGWALASRPEAVKAWDSLSEAEKDRFDHLMATYAACVSYMDRAVGTLVTALKQKGELDNTLILFMSDNGGNAESGPNGRTDGDPTRADSDWFCGQSWAWLQNTPFREYKHYTHEGGISTPLIAHWPKGIPRERQGVLERQPAHLIDIMATVADVSGATYPKSKVKPMEGVSLRPAFSGKPLNRRNPLFWEHEGNRAVREGRWKLVAKENQPWELYDIETDRSEQTNLASKEPGRVKAMAAAWDAWAARANVLPLGGWRGPGGRNAGRAAQGSKANRFTLKGGESLAGGKAPALVGRTFTINAQFESKADTTGVVVSQGGTQFGYTLFVKDGKLTFLLRAEGKTSGEVSLPLPEGAHTAVASLDAMNELKLVLDGQTATGKATGKITRQPVDGLDVGRDTAGAVGPYARPFPFTGTIRSVEITF